ncbi:hypothetical protein AGMMS49928_28500 [Spirochaetia bacterium]|nr:hypothetical protein AGMMS49928_28500 [Spirochaetia bacterium]
MKNKVLIMAIVVSALYAGCLTTSLGVYDSSIPLENLCTLVVDAHLDVKEFDGKVVVWDAPMNNISIQIPEGRHVFVIDYGEYETTNRGQSVYYSADSIDFTYDFVAGKTYLMTPQRVNRSVVIHITEKY